MAGSPYRIVPSAAVGTGLSNYMITYENGALTVNRVRLQLHNHATTARPTGGRPTWPPTWAPRSTRGSTARTWLSPTAARVTPPRPTSTPMRSPVHSRWQWPGERLRRDADQRHTDGQPGCAHDHGRQHQQNLRRRGDLRRHQVHRVRAGDCQCRHGHERDPRQRRGGRGCERWAARPIRSRRVRRWARGWATTRSPTSRAG